MLFVENAELILPDDSTTVSPTSTTPPLDESELLLGDSIKPTNYKLQIFSDQENDSFNGSVIIDLDISNDVSLIKLHCKDLNIIKYSLKNSIGEDVELTSLQTDSFYELCNFGLSKSAQSGQYSLSLEFSGEFKTGQITGFYKSSYLTLDNQVRYLTATKFEPTYARMAFPCFDEPKFKASFEISIIHSNSFVAISNEIEDKTVPYSDGWSETFFKKTVPMSTYLVAYVVSEFKYTETRTDSGTRVC